MGDRGGAEDLLVDDRRGADGRRGGPPARAGAGRPLDSQSPAYAGHRGGMEDLLVDDRPGEDGRRGGPPTRRRTQDKGAGRGGVPCLPADRGHMSGAEEAAHARHGES
jgi:hypothetical protein